MPNLTFPKSALEPRPNAPAGIHDVMFKGFKQALSKKQEGKEQTINLNPEIVICNSPLVDKDGKPLNGQKIFTSLNVSFVPGLQDFFHCFGDVLIENGDNVDLPGSFAYGTDDPDPKKWGPYSGLILNAIGKIELAEVKSTKPGAKATDTRSEIKRYICALPGCTVKHMESLIRS